MVVKADLGDLAQREVVSVRVEGGAALLHELIPVSLTNRGVAQVGDERHRLLEIVHHGLHGRPGGPLAHLPADFLQLFADAHRHILHDLDVQVLELAILESVVNADPFLADGPQVVQQLCILLRLEELLEGRARHGEYVHARLELLLLRAETRGLFRRGGQESLCRVQRKPGVGCLNLLGRLRHERVPVVDDVLHELVHGPAQLLLERLFRLVEVRRRLGEHVDKGHPAVVEGVELGDALGGRGHVHPVQGGVNGA